MNGICIGDLHSGLVYKGISFNERINGCLEQVYVHVKKPKNNVSFIVFLGDIFHNMHYSVDALIFIIEWFRRLSKLQKDIFVIEGNHDKKKFGRDNKSMFDVLRIVGFPFTRFISGQITFHTFEGVKTHLMFIPYLDKSNVPKGEGVQEYIDSACRNILKSIMVKGHDFVVFSHLSVQGAKAGSEIELIGSADINLPRVLIKSKKVSKIFNGHIHLPQEIDKVVMPGSIESFRFGEGNKRYFVEFAL